MTAMTGSCLMSRTRESSGKYLVDMCPRSICESSPKNQSDFSEMIVVNLLSLWILWDNTTI